MFIRLFAALAVCAGTVLSGSMVLHGQAKGRNAPPQAKLSLKAVVAATEEDGRPAALRITLKNISLKPIYVPYAPEFCEPDGGIQIELKWKPDDPKAGGAGWGHGCGNGDQPSLFDRVKDEWIRLLPGEYFVFTEELRTQLDSVKHGTVEYWVEFLPPSVSAQDSVKLRAAGYLAPTEKLSTEHKFFHIE